MRTVEPHLLEDKMDEVTHYINSHHQHSNDHVHIDTNGIPMTVQDDGGSRVTVMHQQTFTTQMCRQVSGTEQVGDGPWGEELLEGPIAAIVAHLQNARHHSPTHKVPQIRNEVDTSAILDGTMRFNGQSLEQPTEPLVVQLPPMQTLPPLQDMKRCTDADWFSDKNKKDEQSMLQDSDSQVLELASSSPAQHKQQSRKSLPHKKRISRKLKRTNGSSTPQQDQLVVINCSEAVSVPPEQEQILPDNYVAVPHATHMSHEVRPVLICQICGEYYGEEQLKFYHHLRQHYEPHHTIIIENPVPDLPCDKMSNNCIVDNVATLPDSIVELSLENTVPKTLYQPIDKHILYTSSEKTLTYNTNKIQYSMGSMEKEGPAEADKAALYGPLDKLDLYHCGKCTKTFRKQKQCEAHMREAHPANTKCEDMGEFSEPEDLMAGIQVCVGGEYEAPPPPAQHHLLPHLTVDNGHVHQDHTTPWYGRGPAPAGAGAAGGPCSGYCGVCARDPDTPYKLLKEEVLQRIFDSEVSDNANFADNMMSDHDVGDHDHNHDHEHENNEHNHGHNDHGHRHIDHGHEHSERSHEHNEPHIHNDHPQMHSEHLRHSEHSQTSQGHNEHDQDHSELSHGHNEQNHAHDHNDHSHEHNDHGHEHNDHGHEHNGHGHEHNDHSHEHNDHAHEHNDHGHEHNDHSQEHNETSQPQYEMPKQEQADIKVKRFRCTKCERAFSHRNSLLYHILSHEGKQHTCRECGKEFYTHGALKIHRRVHNNVRPYKCEVCGREFRQWSDLKYHVISLHTDKKHFKCEYCGKEFARKYSLNLHVRIHTGEKNYKCEYCAKTFRCSSYRLTHMRTHTGDRPYKCDECEKSFRSAFDLRRHYLVHDKIRNRFDEHKPKPKDNQKKTKMTDTKEEKEKVPSEPPPKKIKQIAVASTTRQAVPTKKLQKPKKISKKGAPNVTIQNREGQFKMNDEFSNNIEVYDGRAEYTKLKNIYGDRNQMVFKDQSQQRELAILRPIGHRPESVEEKVPYRAENTDGKMQVFTHVEKGKDYNGSIVTNTQVMGDMRHLEREVPREARTEIGGEGIETAFLERLTAMYNIPAV